MSEVENSLKNLEIARNNKKGVSLSGNKRWGSELRDTGDI